MLISLLLICIPINILAYVNYFRIPSFNRLNVFKKPENTGLQVIDEKLPIYPYIDTPINLFFGYNKASDSNNSNLFVLLDQIEKQGNGNNTKYDDGLLFIIDYKANESKPEYEFKPPCNNSISTTTQNVDYYRKFDKLVYDPQKEYVEEVKVDLAEYDAVCPGLGKWPSHKDIVDAGLSVNTTLFPKFKPVKGLTSIPPIQPYRKEIKTIGEAIIEQRKWLDRSRIAYRDWNLDWEEMSGLPLRIRESYYKIRFDIIKNNPALVFELALKMRRSGCENSDDTDNTHDNIPYHPMEFRYMEDSYTYVKRDSPVSNDLYRWHDPLDASWRLRIEELIKDAVSYDWPPTDLRVHSGLVLHDVTWIPGIIKIFVKRADKNEFVAPEVLGEVSKKELELLFSKIDAMLKKHDLEEEWGIYDNHKIEIYNSLPNEYPESRKDWNEKIGVSVIIKLKGQNNKEIKGKLAGSDSVFGLKLDVDDKIITIPTHFIDCITTNI